MFLYMIPELGGNVGGGWPPLGPSCWRWWWLPTADSPPHTLQETEGTVGTGTPHVESILKNNQFLCVSFMPTSYSVSPRFILDSFVIQNQKANPLNPDSAE